MKPPLTILSPFGYNTSTGGNQTMLKKILLPVLAVLVIAAAAGAYLFSVNSAHFTAEQTTVVTVVENEAVYVIKFTDPDGNPVPGVMANVCDDTACTMLTSDDDGVAHFAGEKKAWSVQILKAPEGFAFTADKLPLNESGETAITLNRE